MINKFSHDLTEGQRIFVEGTLRYVLQKNEAGKKITKSSAIIPEKLYLSKPFENNSKNTDINEIHLIGRVTRVHHSQDKFTFVSVVTEFFNQ